MSKFSKKTKIIFIICFVIIVAISTAFVNLYNEKNEWHDTEVI